MSTPGSGHPCFDRKAHGSRARIHLPVAPRCNVVCAYCERVVGAEASGVSRPGVAAALMRSDEVAAAVDAARRAFPTLAVVGVAGPGDPLANDDTFAAFRVVRDSHPDLRLCVSTNGLVLVERLEELRECGVSSVSVTVNAVAASVGRVFYRQARLRGRTYRGDAFDVLSYQQLRGIQAAARAGLTVKVNTVLVPGVNDGHIPEVAALTRRLGATVMNIIPLLPASGAPSWRPPTGEELAAARVEAEGIIPQFNLCKQCRADACGVPGKEERPTEAVGGGPGGGHYHG